MKAAEGCTVKIEYKGTLEDGTVFDASENHGQPLEFSLGAKQVIPGFENAVMGMEVGEEKDVTIAPADGYGEVRDELRQEVPVANLPEGVEVGSHLQAQVMGRVLQVKVLAIEGENATLDMNHPLAGKTLNFHIKLVDCQKAAQESEE